MVSNSQRYVTFCFKPIIKSYNRENNFIGKKMNAESKLTIGIDNLENMLGYYCNEESIVFLKENEHVDNKETFSSSKFLPALAFHSFNVFRSPFGNAVHSNEKTIIDSMMPIYVENKNNEELDCQVVFENKAFALMVITDYLNKFKTFLLSNDKRLNATVEIDIAPLVASFKEALDNKFVNKLSLVEANKKGFRLS